MNTKRFTLIAVVAALVFAGSIVAITFFSHYVQLKDFSSHELSAEKEKKVTDNYAAVKTESSDKKKTESTELAQKDLGADKQEKEMSSKTESKKVATQRNRVAAKVHANMRKSSMQRAIKQLEKDEKVTESEGGLTTERVRRSESGSTTEADKESPGISTSKEDTVLYGKAPTGYGYYIKLAVMVDKKKRIREIKDNGTKPKEDSVSPELYNKSKALFKKLEGLTLEDIKKLQVKAGGTHEEKVDAISGATYSCNAIKEAILDAYGEKNDDEAFIRDKKDPQVLKRYEGDKDIVIIPEDITVIDEYSFSGKEKVKKVMFHKNVAYINPKAFDTCTNLTDFYVDKDNPEYYTEKGVLYDKKIDKKLIAFPCGRTGEYSIEDDVTHVGNKAFYSSRITALRIHSKVKSLGEGFVDYANNLENIVVDDGNEAYSSEDGIVYDKSKTTILFVPPGITGEHTLASSVKHIGEFAFYSCSKLTKINLPKDLTEISLGAFAGCGGIRSIDLPSGLRSIGDRAFAGWVKLEEITLPEGLEEFGNFVFTDCINLQNIKVDELNSNFNSKKGVLFNAKGTILYAYPTGREGDYVIPEKTEEIKNGAFYTAMNIGRVTVPDTVTKVGEFSFGLPNPDKIPKKLVIVARESSVAHQNAVKNGIAFEKKSDHVDKGESSIPKGTVIKDKGLTYKTTSNNTVYLTSIDDALQEVVIPDEVSYQGQKLPVVQINTNVLSETSQAESLVIGNKVRKIMDVALLGCDSLKRVYLGSSVAECDYSAFNNCSGLEEINVAEENEYFTSDNGVLYKKDGVNLILLRYPSARLGDRYEVMEHTVELSQNAFERAKNLSELEVPDTVTNAGDEDTFYRPKSYKMLTIIGDTDSFIKSYYEKYLGEKQNVSFREKV